jgi:hypothetical protein
MSNKTNSVAASRKTAAQVKTELINKINAKVGKEKIDIDREKYNIMAQYIDQYQYEQVYSVENGKVNTEDADGEENEFSLKELDVDVLVEICDALKIK